MLENALVVITLLLTVIGIAFLVYYLRKTEKRNHIVTTHESLLHWQEVKCSHCGKSMEQGYSFTGKGISWTPRHGRKAGNILTIVSILENTFSMRLPQPLNMAWHCNQCKLIVIDHSKMVRFKKSGQ